jgi:GNAT superfamily N-acetyltransferase
MGIRKARVDDAKGIRRLLDQLEYPGSESFLEAKLEKMVQDQAELLLVWEEGDSLGSGLPAGGIDGRILGLLSLHFIPQLALEGDFARISYFAVDEDARSGGIGRAMEEYATGLARERGCHLIEVHCHERRARAHAFYSRQGYDESPKYLIKRLLY